MGQGWPNPSKTPNTPVPCPATSPACTGLKLGLLTAPYSDPIKTFVGRYHDSQISRDFQWPERTLRARTLRIVPEKNRIYMIVGSTLIVYDLPSFFNRLNAGEAMIPVTTIPSRFPYSNRDIPETVLKFDQYFYAEDSGWQIFNTDGQDRLFGFDYDDRGYVYPAYERFGWGILKDGGYVAGNTGFSAMESKFQVVPSSTDFPALTVMSVKSGTSYYVIISDSSGAASNVWYVGDTNTLAHDKRPNIPIVIRSFAKPANGRLATVETNGKLRIYSPDGIINGTFLQEFAPPCPNGGTCPIYYSVATDGTNLYAVSFAGTGTTATLTVLTPDSNGVYTRLTDISAPTLKTYGNQPTVRVGAGYIAIFGQEFVPALGANLRLYKFAGTTLTEVPLNVGSAQPVPAGMPSEYFLNYYYRNPTPGYTHPEMSGVDGTGLGDAEIFKSGGKYYLIVAAVGLGDVYELRGNDTIVPSVKKVGAAVNPNAQSSGAGPYYGDKITFTSTTTSSVPPPVNWTFSGDTATYPKAANDPDIVYQFGGLTASSFTNGPVTKVATATVDANEFDSVQVKIQPAVPRIAIGGHPELLFTQSDVSSPAPIVSSDMWVDASDGAVEGHWDNWNIAGTAQPPSLPTDTFSVGACGGRTVNFTAHYGPNGGPPSFPLNSTEAPYSLTNIKYNVRPYTVDIKDPVPDPNIPANVLFAAAIRTTTTTADLPGQGGTSATYTWDLLNNDGTSANLNKTGPGSLGNPTTFSVPKSRFDATGKQVRLTVQVGSATTCASFATQTQTVTSLTGPSGTLAQSDPNGCKNLGSPCSFVFTPANPAWTYRWTATGAGTVAPQTGQGAQFATYTPSFPGPGAYTISLTVENAIGAFTPQSLNITLAQPLCASAPTAANTTIGYGGVTTGCQDKYSVCSVGETINFTTYAIGWSRGSCDTYDWDFGDGSAHSTSSTPSHAYTTSGNFPVTLILTGGMGSPATITTTVYVGTPQPTPTPPTPTPPTPTPPNPGNPQCGTLASTSFYIGYIGGTSLCSANYGSCLPNELIAFDAHGQNGYSIGCTTHGYAWSFGDGGLSTDPAPTHKYTANGNYTVGLTVNNGVQSATTYINVKVGNVPTQTCPALTAQNLSPGYSSTNANCRPGGACNAGAPINFYVDLTNYQEGCAIASYSWSGPNGATSTSPNPAFTFTGPGDFTVNLTVSNAGTPSPVTIPIPVHVVADQPQCPAPTAQNLDFTWSGLESTCKPGGIDCKDSETVSFYVISKGYPLNCSAHTYDWNFRDGSPVGGGLLINHKFTGAGVFDVAVTIHNALGGEVTLSQKVRVANANGVTPAPPGARKRPSRGGTSHP